ncbi:hypothetical protein Ahy_A08g039450 isoform D [Arachis hypogaea]|uniref:Uncharacterized protein n=1 Tax=Arachis hypogaea TaxID=3818 RepID=A0A445BWC3_ARAHY|nr:hypothetical protein Ahy_A08g039450 isoform D [Arachis hypogaea]
MLKDYRTSFHSSMPRESQVCENFTYGASPNHVLYVAAACSSSSWRSNNSRLACVGEFNFSNVKRIEKLCGNSSDFGIVVGGSNKIGRPSIPILSLSSPANIVLEPILEVLVEELALLTAINAAHPSFTDIVTIPENMEQGLFLARAPGTALIAGKSYPFPPGISE